MESQEDREADRHDCLVSPNRQKSSLHCTTLFRMGRALHVLSLIVYEDNVFLTHRLACLELWTQRKRRERRERSEEVGWNIHPMPCGFFFFFFSTSKQSNTFFSQNCSIKILLICRCKRLYVQSLAAVMFYLRHFRWVIKNVWGHFKREGVDSTSLSLCSLFTDAQSGLAQDRDKIQQGIPLHITAGLIFPTTTWGKVTLAF